jgi:CubicO group peptidase (beta-lactamase class C family)
MYVTAGYLAGVEAGTTWENLVKQRIFVPVGMTHSNTSAVELQRSPDYAHPHDLKDGKPVPIPVYDCPEIRGGAERRRQFLRG